MPESSYDDRIEAHKAKLFQRLPELAAQLDWNDETLRAHRRQGLHEILNFAITHSEWHAKRLASFDLDLIDPADLQSLPIMTKADVMQNWDQIVTDHRLSLAAASAHAKALEDGPALLQDEYHVFTTGGTTGEPGVFCLNSDEMATWLAASLRLTIKAGFTPERTAWVAARRYSHGSGGVARWLKGPDAEELIVPVDQPIFKIVEKLNAIQPDGLFTLGSMVAPLAEAARRGDLDIRLGMIKTGGDTLSPEAANLCEEVFGIRPRQSYPNTDVGTIADQIGDELVANDDLLIIEYVDEGDRPVPPGSACHHLLVTSLYQKTIPVIRYRIDDRVTRAPATTSSAEVSCGPVSPAFTRILSIDGRSDEILRYGEIAIHPHVVRSVLAHAPGLIEYQVTQTANGVDVAVVVAATTRLDTDLDWLTQQLRTELTRAGLADPVVHVARRESLPRTALGKRQLFVPLAAES